MVVVRFRLYKHYKIENFLIWDRAWLLCGHTRDDERLQIFNRLCRVYGQVIAADASEALNADEEIPPSQKSDIQEKHIALAAKKNNFVGMIIFDSSNSLTSSPMFCFFNPEELISCGIVYSGENEPESQRVTLAHGQQWALAATERQEELQIQHGTRIACIGHFYFRKDYIFRFLKCQDAGMSPFLFDYGELILQYWSNKNILVQIMNHPGYHKNYMYFIMENTMSSHPCPLYQDLMESVLKNGDSEETRATISMNLDDIRLKTIECHQKQRAPQCTCCQQKVLSLTQQNVSFNFKNICTVCLQLYCPEHLDPRSKICAFCKHITP